MSEVTDEVKVSIIVPVYNTEKYLRQCLDSILSQTLKEIEVICVNDGSTDSSGEILEEYRRMDKRVKVICLNKCSIGEARNHGINIAQGMYIGFVDSDDFIDSGMFETLYQRVLKYQAQVAITNINLYFDETGTTKLYRDYDLYAHLEKSGVFSAKEAPEILQSIGIWDKLYSRNFIMELHLRNPENIIFEDHLFSFQALILASKITVVNLPLYYYRKNLFFSITGAEIRNDKYKMDFLEISFRIKSFLHATDTYKIFADEFIKYQYTNALWHQSNITSYKNFNNFFYTLKNMSYPHELNTAIKTEPIKVKIYIFALRHSLCRSFYLICQTKNLIKSFHTRRRT